MSVQQEKAFSLRSLEERDVEWILEASQDPDIQQLTSSGGAQTLEQARSLINGTQGDQASWAILASAEPVGVITLHSVDHETEVADVGYWIAPWARRQGAARAAVSLVEAELKDLPGVSTVQLTIMNSNEPSLALARTLGYAEQNIGTCSCGTQGEVTAVIFEKQI